MICLVIAILTSARRADEMALKREQQLIQQAIVERGARMLRQVESVATTDRATQAVREKYDPQWVDEHLGRWLENFFDHDLVVIVDGSDRVEYARSRAGGDLASMPLPRALVAIRDSCAAGPMHTGRCLAGDRPARCRQAEPLCRAGSSR